MAQQTRLQSEIGRIGESPIETVLLPRDSIAQFQIRWISLDSAHLEARRRGIRNALTVCVSQRLPHACRPGSLACVGASAANDALLLSCGGSALPRPSLEGWLALQLCGGRPGPEIPLLVE